MILDRIQRKIGTILDRFSTVQILVELMGVYIVSEWGGKGIDLRIKIELVKYNKIINTLLVFIQNRGVRKVGLFVSRILNYVPKFSGYVKLKKESIEVVVGKEVLVVPHNGIEIEKGKDIAKISFEIQNMDIGSLVSIFADEKTIANRVLREMIDEINSAVDERAKIELIQFLLSWISKNDIINVAITELAQNDVEIANKIKNLDLKIGNIELDI